MTLAILTLSLLALAGSPSPAPAPSILLGSGAKMCDALTPADLKAQGLSPDAKTIVNVPEPISAYCTYAGKSGATGGIEMDVFAAGTDALDTQKTILGELGGMKPAGYPGVDESLMNLEAVSGGPKFAVLVVRKAGLVFTLSLPSAPKAKDQLFALAKLVLSRLK
ncbi:MAG TPA: hypothetical protein VFA20_14065 [Myxococcaceae bacterium]|nr:hypothetical protein [Myxococcaceae bacterium]